MANYNRKDSLYKKAKKEGYVARSAYKLLELDEKFRILKPSNKLVDLGCAPGGWLQVAEEKKIQAIGIDLLPLHYEPGPTISFIQGDFLIDENQKKIISLLQGKANWVLSDMSPNISGIPFKDTLASSQLCEMALVFATKVLKKGGGLVVKLFPGPELDNFKKKMRQHFERSPSFVLDSTRTTSNEIYLVGSGFKG